MSDGGIAIEPAPPIQQRRDYTKGSINSAIFALGVPMTLEMAMISLYQVADLYWVGRLGSAALAAVAIAITVRWVLNSLSMGLGVGGLAVVARRIGAKQHEKANHAVAQAILLSFVLSLFLSALGLVTMRPMLRVLGAGPDVLPLGVDFLRVTYLGMWAIVMVPIINSLYRGAGDARIALGVLAFANVLNIVIEPFLVLGWWGVPRLGVGGAALSTVIAQTAGLLLQIGILASGRARIRLHKRDLLPDLPIMRRVLTIGAPSTVQMLLRASSRVTLLGLVGLFGTLSLAGYGVANRILLIAFIPGFGMGNAAATLVGQNLGALQPKRAARSAWLIAAYNIGFMAIFAVFAFLAAPGLIAFFDHAPVVVNYGATGLRIVGVSYIFSAMGVVLARGLDGAGNTVPAMSINLLSLWVVQIPIAYVLSKSFLGADGIWVGIAIGNIANGLLMAYWFYRGHWKKKDV
ncbi:MAG: MATE family efflux transporter [Chloroflexi bacterium]|nr:MATE family efflux transporter [Chloroflexota bacterium]